MIQESVSVAKGRQLTTPAILSLSLSRGEGTYVTSVKKIFLLVGWILTSFRLLNCLPKKLSRRTVVLKGACGLTRTRLGGRGPRPDVMRRSSERKFVAPFVIWTESSNGT